MLPTGEYFVKNSSPEHFLTTQLEFWPLTVKGNFLSRLLLPRSKQATLLLLVLHSVCSLADLYADRVPWSVRQSGGWEALLSSLPRAPLAQSFIFLLSGRQSAERNIRVTRTGQPHSPSQLTCLTECLLPLPFCLCQRRNHRKRYFSILTIMSGCSQ